MKYTKRDGSPITKEDWLRKTGSCGCKQGPRCSMNGGFCSMKTCAILFMVGLFLKGEIKICLD